MSLLPTEYQLKRVALYPRILYGRYKERSYPLFKPRSDPLDITFYRRDTYDFLARVNENPDLMYEVEAKPGDKLLDVGAFRGDWASAVAARCPGAEIHCFDLSPPIAAVLDSNVADNPKIFVHRFGLGGSTREVPVSRRFLGSSSMNIKRNEAVDIGKLIDVAEIWRDLDLGDVAAMKINIEGGEYELLDRMANTDLLRRVDTFFIQFHESIRGSYRMRRKIRKALALSHRPTWDYYFAWERWDR